MSENTTEGKIRPKCNVGHFHFVAKETMESGNRIYDRYECDNPKCRNSCKHVRKIVSESLGDKDSIEKRKSRK
jgi:hypothetical protein